VADVVFTSNTEAYAYADAGDGPCSYAFAVMYEPGGGQQVFSNQNLAAGGSWVSADDYTHNADTQLRICINSPGFATVCTPWPY
jgi:hypothetical protein